MANSAIFALPLTLPLKNYASELMKMGALQFHFEYIYGKPPM